MSVTRFVLVVAVGLFCAAAPASAQVDVKVLAALSKDNPQGYYDYAETLARQEGDRETAKRLYLIAAYLDRQKYGSASLLASKAMLGMSKLAGTPPAEALKYRAMAYVLDPKAGPEFLKGDAVSPDPPKRPDKSPTAALESFEKALQLYRAGHIAEAIKAARSEGVDQIFRSEEVEKIFGTAKMDRDNFVNNWCKEASCQNCRANNRLGLREGEILCPTCKGTQGIRNALGVLVVACKTCSGKGKVLCPICGGTHVLPRPDDRVRVVLRAELWALNQDGSGDDVVVAQTTNPNSWSTVPQSARPVSSLKLETITKFDPRECHYHNGKWVK